MMVIDNKFEIGQEVYLITDPEQSLRLVTGIFIRKGAIAYGISFESSESNHYDFEITTQKTII